MTPTKNQTVEINIFTNKVEKDITIHTLQFEKKAIIVFDRLWIGENDNFLFIPNVNVPVFWDGPLREPNDLFV